MVLGIRSKNRKSVAVQVDYLIHVVEINPWPKSKSSKSVQSVILQWENGDQLFGSFTSGVGDGKIEFAESFRLPVTLCKETSKKGESYQKNNLEFSLFEPRNDKGTKVQLLGSAVINLGDYGILKETITLDIPLNCKKSSKNSGQPVLYVNIQPCENNTSSSSPKDNLSKEVSLDKDGNETVSKSMIERNNEEAEIDSFTDDDNDEDDGVSSHSSRTINSSAFETTTVSSPSNSVKNGSETVKDGTKMISGEPAIPPRTEHPSIGPSPLAITVKRPNGSPSPLSSTFSFSSLGKPPANDNASFPHIPLESPMPILKKSVTHSFQSSSTSLGYQHNHETSGNHKFTETLVGSSDRMPKNAQESIRDRVVGNVADVVASSNMNIQEGTNAYCESSISTKEDDGKASRQNKKGHEKEAVASCSHMGHLGDRVNQEEEELEGNDHIIKMKQYSFDAKLASRFSQHTSRKQVTMRSSTSTFRNEDIGAPGHMVKSNKLNREKSVQLPLDSTENSKLLDRTEFMKRPKRVEITKDAHDSAISDTTSVGKETPNSSCYSKGEMESKIEMLKEELREAAALEVGLYSVVAEHGSSTNKIHAPARRLSRFYFHACKSDSQTKKANAARAAISGFILVAKACGNDVPRLTFWLSNSIMLRAIVSQTVVKMQLPAGPFIKHNGRGKSLNEGFTLGKNGLPHKVKKNNTKESFDNWEDPRIFMVALEKFEAWIFSRIVESVWWQTMTPHMQPAAAKGSSSRKVYGKKYGLGDQDQGNFSIDLWKKAFKDACERLCPPRAGGHECGCLPVLPRLVMEQLVGRLDVAMFNAILREDADEMPTDPVSDPISDSKVLPIPAGKSSFGAGAQLKNAIGSWSRWLTDIFGIDDNDAPEDNNELGDDKKLECQTPFKPFRLLNALSDLMMLPHEVLADKSTRKEVCPTFSEPLIKQVLYTFVPDEFCPNPIPNTVLEALDYEDNFEAEEESLTSYPCSANPTVYSPPSAASLSGITGEVGSQTLLRSGSSLLRKAYTSDDELDELDSPMTSIIADKFQVSPSSLASNSILKEKGDRKVVRYQLLREIWKDGE